MARRKSPKNNPGMDQAVSPGNGSAFSDAANLVESMAVARVARVKSVLTDSRANLIPIDLDGEIRRLAYLLSEQRGFEPGHETEDWLNSEREVLGRTEQQRA